MKWSLLAGLIIGTALWIPVNATYAQGRGPRCCAGQNQDPTGTLSTLEEARITYMREEEKLARDVYRAMFARWDDPVFETISFAEERHMAAMKRLIDRYGLDDPILDDSPGTFSDATLATHYETLIAQGDQSRLDALKAGALIEEMDIFDLQQAIAATDRPDVQRVFENLMRASRNHLRAFAAQIEDEGGTYEAQYLTQEEFDRIAASDVEPGCGWGRGRGCCADADRVPPRRGRSIDPPDCNRGQRRQKRNW